MIAGSCANFRDWQQKWRRCRGIRLCDHSRRVFANTGTKSEEGESFSCRSQCVQKERARLSLLLPEDLPEDTTDREQLTHSRHQSSSPSFVLELSRFRKQASSMSIQIWNSCNTWKSIDPRTDLFCRDFRNMPSVAFGMNAGALLRQ